jgi:hypothetical protein
MSSEFLDCVGAIPDEMKKGRSSAGPSSLSSSPEHAITAASKPHRITMMLIRTVTSVRSPDRPTHSPGRGEGRCSRCDANLRGILQSHPPFGG